MDEALVPTNCSYNHHWAWQCSKCLKCGECTNGSQIHKFCFEFVDEPETYIPIRSDQEASILWEEVQNMENSEMFDLTYHLQKEDTSIYIAHETLTERYPYEDFTTPAYTGIELHRYLTREVNEKEFFMMHNQWDTEILNLKKLKEGKGVFIRMNCYYRNNGEKDCVYHVDCLNEQKLNIQSAGYIKGWLLARATSPTQFVNLIIRTPDLFFCHACKHFIFQTVEYQFSPLPLSSVWPNCHVVQNRTKIKHASIVLTVERLSVLIKPLRPEPPAKRPRLLPGWIDARRELDFDE
uniref:NS3 n=1 Tax=Ambidensovirus CaaDV2 TaxID=1979849 RepID=A0A1W5YP78_9VIRU|nr:NS3 [Ambidensovirus CaaDV2]ASY04032.1 NS3 [Densovirinae sp.]